MEKREISDDCGSKEAEISQTEDKEALRSAECPRPSRRAARIISCGEDEVKQSETIREGQSRARSKSRIVLSDYQNDELEKAFLEDNNLTFEVRTKLSNQLGISGREITLWFDGKQDEEKKPRAQCSSSSSIEEDDEASSQTKKFRSRSRSRSLLGLSDNVKAELEKAFLKDNHLKFEVRTELSKRLNISEHEVINWYRMKRGIEKGKRLRTN